jgi:hypothetical protein
MSADSIVVWEVVRPPIEISDSGRREQRIFEFRELDPVSWTTTENVATLLSMADETTDKPEVVDVLLPPEEKEKAEKAAEQATVAEAAPGQEEEPAAPKVDKPVSKATEWALAVAIMLFLGAIFWLFSGIFRGGV